MHEPEDCEEAMMAMGGCARSCPDSIKGRPGDRGRGAVGQARLTASRGGVFVGAARGRQGYPRSACRGVPADE